MSTEIIRVIPYEDQGFFFEVTFEGDSDTTVFFVANRDLEQLRSLARNPDKSEEQFRNELQTLVDHSGLQNKTFSSGLLETFRRNLSRDDPWPDKDTNDD